MKKYLNIFLIIALAVLFTACDPKDKKEENKSDVGSNGELIDFSQSRGVKKTIKVWFDDKKGEYSEEIVKEFNKVHPNIIVEYSHKAHLDSREHLKTFGPSGNGADVFQFPHDHLATAVLEDLVLPLPEATRTKIEARTNAASIQAATMKFDEQTKKFTNDANAVAKLYAVPLSVETIGLYYNKKYISQPATTYEQIIADAKIWNETKADGSVSTNAELGNFYLGNASHWADSYYMQHIFSAFGWTPFGPDLNDSSQVGFEGLETAMNWIRNELKPQVTGNGTAKSIPAASLFEEGKIPYLITGPWANDALDKIEGFDYDITTLPSINGKATKPFSGSIMASVYKYSKNSEDAIKFVEFLNTDAAMKVYYKHTKRLPALKSELLSNVEGVNQNTKLMKMAEQLKNAYPMPGIPQVQNFWEPAEAMQVQIWDNNADIREALKNAETSYKTKEGLTE